MKRRFPARGFAAASLALVSSTAVPGPSGATRAGEAASTVAADTGSGLVRPAAPHVGAAAVARASHASRDLHRRRALRRLVEVHEASRVADPERECLAGAVYFEAQGEPIEGQLAVAEVVLNRAASGEYPRSICGVVKQPAQFSFVLDGRFPEIDRRSLAWRKAVAVAHIAAENLAGTLSSDVLWYHADYVAPGWGRRLDRVTRIGAHIFYRSA